MNPAKPPAPRRRALRVMLRSDTVVQLHSLKLLDGHRIQDIVQHALDQYLTNHPRAKERHA